MIYDLHWDLEAHRSFMALPLSARHEFGVALIEAQADPLARTGPYGHDDGTVRALATGSILSVLLIGQFSKTLTILQVSHLG